MYILYIYIDRYTAKKNNIEPTAPPVLRGHLLPGGLLAAPRGQRARPAAALRRAAAHALLGALHLAARRWGGVDGSHGKSFIFLVGKPWENRGKPRFFMGKS